MHLSRWPCLLERPYEHAASCDNFAAEETGRAYGNLFRALEQAYDMGIAHGRKVAS